MIHGESPPQVPPTVAHDSGMHDDDYDFDAKGEYSARCKRICIGRKGKRDIQGQGQDITPRDAKKAGHPLLPTPPPKALKAARACRQLERERLVSRPPWGWAGFWAAAGARSHSHCPGLDRDGLDGGRSYVHSWELFRIITLSSLYTTGSVRWRMEA